MEFLHWEKKGQKNLSFGEKNLKNVLTSVLARLDVREVFYVEQIQTIC